MTSRIFRSILIVALAVFLSSLVLILGAIYTYYGQLQQEQLRTQTRLAAQGASHEGLEYFSNLSIENCRVTWIDQNGTVLYDNRSQTEDMENHFQRKEVQDALKNGFGESSRYSATLLERSLYCAQKLPDGTILRLSTTQNSVLTLILGFAQPICIVIAVALALSLFLSFRLSRKIVQPLNDLDLDAPMQTKCYEELTPLLHRLEAQQCQLRTQSAALVRKQNEFDAVTKNMSEGLVLLGSNCTILSMNTAARQLLGLHNSDTGTDILSYRKDLSSILLTALNGKHSEQMLSLSNGDYLAEASPVFHDEMVSGVVLLIFDITQKRKAELMRREFTANVSHELKTPLHSISGYAELMSHGIVPEKDTKAFSNRIYVEAQRMIHLVEDIIHLSQLDEGAGVGTYEAVDLFKLACECLEALRVEAEAKNVELHLKGHSVVIQSVPHLVSGILRNLCDNAIKYNRSDGSVTVTVGADHTHPFVSVADTGIGIPLEHQDRVFERFYRVDKSHSKAVGGTGLGLSIVKHASIVLGAALKLESCPDQGTTITITFPAIDK